MNSLNGSKIQLYQLQVQLQKQLKSKKDLLTAAKRSYNKNKKIAQEQMELIKHLTNIQNSYYETISHPLPVPDSKFSQFHQYRHLIDDLDKSYKEIEDENELAFPLDEEISPNVDHYSDLYDQLDSWLQKKENILEEGDEQQIKVTKEIETLKKQNAQLKEEIENEPDLSEQINEIKKEINERKSLLSSRDEIISIYQQKKEELNFITDSLDASQKKINEENNESEDDEDNNIKIDKEVNVQTLNKIQLKCLKKWEQLNKCQIERQIHETKMKNFMSFMMNFLKT